MPEAIRYLLQGKVKTPTGMSNKVADYDCFYIFVVKGWWMKHPPTFTLCPESLCSSFCKEASIGFCSHKENLLGLQNSCNAYQNNRPS